MLNYLATRPKLAAFVTQALIQLYARITKLGWFDCQKDDYVFRNVIADVTRFLQVCLSSLLPRRRRRRQCFPSYWCHCVIDVPWVCQQDSVEHCIIGVTILSQLTNEINQVGRRRVLALLRPYVRPVLFYLPNGPFSPPSPPDRRTRRIP